MASMYAKLMSRITESSLMEEGIEVRYCFMMLLAIADPKGYVIGTDVAIARRLNVPTGLWKACRDELMKPDPDSNSKENEGRRIIESDGERGYYVVNYVKYRETRDEEDRRNYMKEYMRKYREGKDVAPVNNGKHRKPKLANAEGEGEDKKRESKNPAENPPKESPTTHHSAHAEFIQYWSEGYPEHHDGAAYVFAGAKDGAAVKALLLSSKLTSAELFELAVSAWKNPTGFHCKAAAALSTFNSQFNQIREEIRNHGKKPAANPSGTTNRNANLNAHADYSVIPKRTGEAPHWSEGSPG